MWMSVWGPARGPSDQKMLEQTGRAAAGPKAEPRWRWLSPCWQCRGGWAWGGKKRPKHHLIEALEQLSPLHSDPPRPCPRKNEEKRKYEKKRPYLSPTTVFPAAAKCMSSNGGALRDWPLFTPDIHARQLFLTLPFYMPTTPPPLHRQRSPLQFDTLLLKDLCCNKKQQLMFFLCCRRSSVLPDTRRRDVFSSRRALSLCLYYFLFIVLYPG